MTSSTPLSLDQARITDRAYIIREGEVFRTGTPRALATDAEVRRVYLGDDFDLMLPEVKA